MLLKFIGENVDSGPRGDQCPLVIGEVYEVAEILEHDWHVMVRKPGDSRWPRPGDPTFGWHPEFFERTDEPIPIVSCGYNYRDDMSDYFGVCLDDPEDVARVHAYMATDDIIHDRHERPWPQPDETYVAWHARVGHGYPERIAPCVYELEKMPISAPAVRIPDDVFLASPGLRIPFATVTYSTQEMVRHDVSSTDARHYITAFLKSLEIAPRQAELLDVGWWAYDEYPRLISPLSCPNANHRQDRIIEGICFQCGQPFQSATRIL